MEHNITFTDSSRTKCLDEIVEQDHLLGKLYTKNLVTVANVQPFLYPWTCSIDIYGDDGQIDFQFLYLKLKIKNPPARMQTGRLITWFPQQFIL